MAHVAHPVEAERVEQPEQVVGERLLAVIAVRRRVRPAEAAEVGGDHPVTLGERGDELAPGPPVLGPAMYEQHGVALAGLGHVQADAAHVHVAVLHSGELGEGRRHGVAS